MPRVLRQSGLIFKKGKLSSYPHPSVTPAGFGVDPSEGSQDGCPIKTVGHDSQIDSRHHANDLEQASQWRIIPPMDPWWIGEMLKYECGKWGKLLQSG